MAISRILDQMAGQTTTNAITTVTALSYPVPANSTLLLTSWSTGKDASGNACAIMRSAMAKRASGNVTVSGLVTLMSTVDLPLAGAGSGIVANGTNVDFQVTSAILGTIEWFVNITSSNV